MNPDRWATPSETQETKEATMIQAMIFDLDGTLVKTEHLKAISYASAAVELDPRLRDDDVYDAFSKVVGRSRREVATYLLDRFQLTEAASKRMREFGVTSPWQAYVQIRLRIYDDMISDPEVLRSNRWKHTHELLQVARRNGCRLALATMSRCGQVKRVLDILELEGVFQVIASRDDVRNGKPDPEIYLLVAEELQVEPGRCLVIEDSPSGVIAGLDAGMNVVAVATPFTREALEKLDRLPRRHLALEPEQLPRVVAHVTQHTGSAG
jgi:HAD superfamily hydrolase (TIGR01509 family)